ncbi:putative ribonuclease H-like domain-containing protein [Tanacetum coccineum]
MFGQDKDANGNSTYKMFTPVSVVGSSYVNLSGSIPVNAATLPNVDLPTDHLMPDLKDTADLQDTGIFSGAYDDEVEGAVTDFNNLKLTIVVSPIPTTMIHKDHPKEKIIGDPLSAPQTKRMTKTSQEHAIANRTQEEGIDYDEVFAPVARIEAIRLFLAYASFMGFIVYKMDVKSAFLYGTIEEDVYVCQPPSFEDPHFPDKVYKVEKALYGLHQAPKAWYETLSTYLLENRFRRGIIDKTLFIKKDKGDILIVQVYVDDIIFGYIKKSLCTEFEGLMHKKFQMSSMGELTFFLGLQVMQRDDGIFISQDKYVADILKKFDFSSVKTSSTPIETNKALLKDKEAKDVDVHLYRSMIGSLMYLTASRPDIMFVVCACARFQVTPKVSHLHAVKRIFRYLKGQPKLGLWYPRDSPFDLEAFFNSDYAGASLDRKSTTGAEYVATGIQNQMLDYGFNFMNTNIHIDNESTIYIVKNLVFHSKTKKIEIRHHFIRDSYEKRLIQVIKIHIDHNVADLLTKAFDVSSDEFRVKTGSCKVNAARQDLVLLGESTDVAKLIRKWSKLDKHGHENGKSAKEPEVSSKKSIKSTLGEDDRVVRAATTATSLEAEQESDAQTRFKTVSKQSRDPPLSEVNTSGSGEDSMEHQDDLIDLGFLLGNIKGTAQDLVIKKLKKKVKRLEKKQRARTPGMKLFKIGTSKRKNLDKENVSKQGRNLKTRSMFEEGDFDDDFDDIDDMVNEEMENVKGDTVNVGGAVNTATTGVSAASASVTTAGVSISTAEPRTPPTTTTTAFEDKNLTIAQTLVNMRSEKAKEKRVAFRDVEESARSTKILPTIDPKDKGKGIMQEPEKPPKNPRKAQIQMDEELAMKLHEEENVELEKMQRERAAQEEASNAALIAEFDDVQARMDADALLAARLQEEEREQFSIDEQARFLVETIAERKRFFDAQRAEQIRNKPPTKTQLRNKMITFLKNMGRFTYNQLKNKSLEEIQKLYEREQKWINDFVPMDSEMVKDSGKKDDDSQKQAESSTKRPRAEHDEESVKKQKLEGDAEKEELRACLYIVPGNDIAINVESLATKYPIVDWKTHILTENMMYYQIIRADGSSKNYKIFSEMLNDFDRQDVVDLYSLVKESEEGEIWKGQQDYKLISWRLFDSCGVHVLLMDTGVAIHMMVEKKYPLTQEMLSRMLNRRLEVDHESTIAFELIRFIKAQLEE